MFLFYTTSMKNQILNSNIQKYYWFNFLRGLFFTSGVLVPFFTNWGHISFAQIQFIQAWFMFWNFVLEIPTGVIADRFGRKTSMILGSLVLSIAALIYGSIPHFYNFLFSEFLFAVGITLISGADKAILYDSLKENNQEHLSIKIFNRAWSIHLLGLLIAAPIGSFMASKLSLNAPMLFMFVPSLLSLFVAWSLKEIKIKDKSAESLRYWAIFKKGLQFFRTNRYFQIAVINSTLIHAAGYFVIWLYQPLITNIKIPIIYFGYFHAFLVLMEILIAHNYQFFEKIFKNLSNYLKFSAIITILGFILVAVHLNLTTVIIFLILSGGFGLTRREVIEAHLNKYIPSSERATIVSSISMFSSLFLVIVNPLIGFLMDKSLKLSLIFISILPLLALLFFPINEKKENL